MLEPEARQPSDLYVDVENLQGDAQELISSLIQDWPAEVPPPFFPLDYLHVVRAAPQPTHSKSLSGPAQPSISSNGSGNAESQEESIAKAIIEEVEISPFKRSDCQSVVQQRFPKHLGAKQDGPAFGQYITKSIWPILEAKGVKLKSTKPRKYEMTQAAKDSIAF